jgi:hypothetical protein
VLALVAALVVQTPDLTTAESLLAAGALRAARAVAERLVERSPDDPRAHDVLGRIWYHWPVVGRYDALRHFQTAARLAPRDPAPWYHQMEVGFHLGSDEGDGIARDAILAILTLDPDYRDVWARFHEVYRNEGIWRRAERALARHGDHPLALLRRSELAVALGTVAAADSLAALALARGAPPVAALLLRADAAFLRGHDATGQRWHDSAVASGATDTTDALWARAWIVAGPDDSARYAATPRHERRRFFEGFWGTRDPNLLTPVNERLGEQTRRLAEARLRYRLLHPQRMVYRSPRARALARFDARGIPTLERDVEDRAMGYAYRAGLDARGLTFVRHGPPDLRVACMPDPRVGLVDPICVSSLDSEGWLYRSAEGAWSVAFRDAEYFGPVTRGQVGSTQALLRNDRSSLPAPQHVTATIAFFKSGTPDQADVYFHANAEPAAVVVWDADGNAVGRAAGGPLLRVALPPGRRRFGLDIDSSGVLGRLRGEVDAPSFAAGDLKLSSVLLAADSTAARREAVLAAMPADLRFAAGASLLLYAEVYGLEADALARVRYRARYTFAPARGDPVSFELIREAVLPPDATVVDRLVLEPGRVPAGRYRVTMAVTDLARNVKSPTVELVVTIR